MVSRQEREAHFHDEKRGEHQRPGSPEYAKYTAYQKWYAVTRSSQNFTKRQAQQRCQNKLVLDYGCGEGEQATYLAQIGAKVIGVDISKVSIQMAKQLAVKKGVADRASFQVGDAEALEFPDNHFDVIWCSGILHHLDVEKAYKELARVLKPDGVVICNEGLGHNPLINLYRARTPYLRSDDEHPLLKPEVDRARHFFGHVERRFFHLATLAAAPFGRLPGFNISLTILEGVDNLLLRLPILQWQAWQVVMVLSQPRKGVDQH